MTSAAAPLRLLFVDDELPVLKLLRVALKPMACEWEMSFVTSGEEALALMATNPVDIVVSDMRMPGMSGAQLLNEVMRRHPRTVRIILSAYSDQTLVMESAGATHQYLSKPFEPAGLKAVLTRIHRLRRRLESEEMRALVAGIRCLPSPPPVYHRILEAMHWPGAPIQAISDIIASDPALASKTLQLVNSAFFGSAQEVSSISEAVQLLGVGILRSLALSIHLFSAFDRALVRELALEELWPHCVRTGVAARRIVAAEGRDMLVMEEAFTAGLLHDIGKLILAASLPERYRVVLEQGRAGAQLVAAETAEFKATHAEVGAYLLGLWSLPVGLVEAVAFHHSPAAAQPEQFGALAAVHAADCLDHAPPGGGVPPGLDLAYLARMGLADRWQTWHAECSGAS